jgi:hypothetical protein
VGVLDRDFNIPGNQDFDYYLNPYSDDKGNGSAEALGSSKEKTIPRS